MSTMAIILALFAVSCICDPANPNTKTVREFMAVLAFVAAWTIALMIATGDIAR